MKTFKKIEDPSHGWLQVPIQEAIDSGIDISHFSYIDDKYVYLEEDCDMQAFMVAAGHWSNGTLHVAIIYEHHDTCFVRDLSHYKVQNLPSDVE